MQIHQRSAVESARRVNPKFEVIKSASTQINGEGCAWLTKAEWKKLVTLELGNEYSKIDHNSLSWSEVRMLTVCEWPMLKLLSLRDNEIDAKFMKV